MRREREDGETRGELGESLHLVDVLIPSDLSKERTEPLRVRARADRGRGLPALGDTAPDENEMHER